MPHMENIKLLRNSLRDNGWCITAFPFHYNGHDYTVLFEVIDGNRLKPQNDMAIAVLIFHENGIPDHILEAEANSLRFFVDYRTIRDYFYINGLGQFNTDDFYKYFGERIPQASKNLQANEETLITSRLSEREGENPNSIYCYDVRRNGTRPDGTLNHRSIYNDNKTRLLRPTLYEEYKNDTHLSFFYSDNPDDKLNDEAIRMKFAEREGRRV